MPRGNESGIEVRRDGDFYGGNEEAGTVGGKREGERGGGKAKEEEEGKGWQKEGRRKATVLCAMKRFADHLLPADAHKILSGRLYINLHQVTWRGLETKVVSE